MRVLLIFLVFLIGCNFSEKPKEEQVDNEPLRMPEFRGGESGMRRYLSKSVNYPQEALDAGISGRVVVQFVVEKDGSIGEVKIVEGVSHVLDEEAVRVIESMPNWKPGKRYGVTDRIYFTLPIVFSLED